MSNIENSNKTKGVHHVGLTVTSLDEARRFFADTLGYEQVVREDLRFMDRAAIALCRENGLPIVVFDMSVSGNIRKVVAGETVGTVVGGPAES